MDRDTRSSAREFDLAPEERLELAGRHLRAHEPLRALELVWALRAGASGAGTEAWPEGAKGAGPQDPAPADPLGGEGALAAELAHLEARAEASLGRWRCAARAARRARLCDPQRLPEGFAAELRAGLWALDPAQPDPPRSAGPLADLADEPPAEPEELAAERVWLRAWLGGERESLLPYAEDHDPGRVALVAGHEGLAPQLIDHPDPCVRARAQEGLALADSRAALAGLAACPPGIERDLRALALAAFRPCALQLRAERQPLVAHRAAGSPELAVFPREPMPTRLFSAHGQDFQTGTFLAAPVLDASCEARLRLLTPETLDLLDLLCGQAFPWRVRGRGYGLARPPGWPEGELEARVGLLNLLELFPLRLRLGRGHMFDVLSERESEQEESSRDIFARYLAADLCRHPARLEGGPEHPLVYARLLALFRPTKSREAPPPADELVAPLLSAGAARYSEVGQAALRLFAEWRGHPPRDQGRRDPYRV